MAAAKTTSHTVPFEGGVDEVHEKPTLKPITLLNGAIPLSFSQILNLRPRRPGFEQRKGCAKGHTTTSNSTKDITSLYQHSKGGRVERAFFAQYDDGHIEKATTSPPGTTTGDFGSSVLPARITTTTITMTIASPAVVTWAAHGLQIDSPVKFTTTGALPTGLTADVWYYIISTGFTAGTFQLSATQGGTAINTSGSQSGTHTGWAKPPASATWSNFKDYCIVADGAGIPLINTGTAHLPLHFNVYRGTAAIPTIPTDGADYTTEVTDGRSSTYADISNLDRVADYHAIFIVTEVPINKITFAMSTFNANNVGSLAVNYWNGTSRPAVTGLADGTELAGVAFGQDGSLTWTLPTDEVPHYAFGASGFVYRIAHSHATVLIDADTKIKSVTVENTTGFQVIQNVWDGVMYPAVEAVVEKSTVLYERYSSSAIVASALTTSQYIYISSIDPIIGFYLDVGKTPNTTASTTISEVAYWSGSAFVTVGSSLVDGTGGGQKTGFVTFVRPPSFKRNFNGSQIGTHWYRIKFSTTLSAALTWSIQTLPYFDINEIGTSFKSCVAWDKRMVYTNKNYMWFSARYKPMTINGDDSGFFPVGDERQNEILVMKPFYMALLVWQEERGGEGGATTLIEPGSTPSKVAQLPLSNRVGIVNSKSVDIVEAVNVADLSPQVPIMKVAYWISRYGIFKTDGRVIKNISGGVGNYFNPQKSECIRTGYESKHWLKYDPSEGVIRIGLCSGSSATKANKFFILDPVTEEYATDTLAQPLSCICDVEAASGDIAVLQYGGGQDGYVRQLNTGNKDDTTDITSSVVMDFNIRGKKAFVRGINLRAKSQASGSIVRTIAKNGNTSFGESKTLSMIAETANDSYRSHAVIDSVHGGHFAIKLENTTSNVPMYLLDFGVEIDEIENNV